MTLIISTLDNGNKEGWNLEWRNGEIKEQRNRGTEEQRNF
jgi:hypothetical protein